MSNFRVRRTDDTRHNTWCVADGGCYTDTHCYIDGGGNKNTYCCPFSTSRQAQAALDLYLGKQEQKSDKDIKLYGHPRFYEILEQMKDLHSKKNHDYAGTSDPLKNLRACKRLELEPFMGVMVRLQDKWSRLEEFIKSGKLMVKGESVIDTLMDNAVYSVLAIILYEEQQKEQKQETKPGYGGNVDA